MSEDGKIDGDEWYSGSELRSVRDFEGGERNERSGQVVTY